MRVAADVLAINENPMRHSDLSHYIRVESDNDKIEYFIEW